MARGKPDGGFQQYLTGANISDLGWMTYMLWGFAPLDSLGRPVFLDTFNNGIGAWTAKHDGATAADPVLTTRHTFVAPSAVKFDAGLSGPVGAGTDSILTKLFQLRSPTRAGLEVAWDWEPGGCPFEQVMDYQFDATHFYEASIRYDPNLGQWLLQTNSGYLAIVNDAPPAGTISPAYVQVKLVADFSTGKYVRAIIGQQALDLSNGVMPIFTFTQTQGNLTIDLDAWGDGTREFHQAGYVLLTKDEP